MLIARSVLQYALTLEHLENTFYAEGLSKYNEKAFTDAGIDSSVRQRISEIGGHEKSHVSFRELTLPISVYFVLTLL